MPDTILKSVLTGKLDSDVLIKWLNNEAIEDDCVLLCCKRNEFVACFLSYLRNQTDSILQTNSNAVQILQNSTPEKAHARRKHHRSVSEPTSDDRDSLSVKSEKSNESPNRDRKRPGRRVKTTLFPDDRKESNLSVSSDESRLSTSMDRMAVSSTPLKNGVKAADYSNLSLSSPVTPRSFFKDGERCDTPRLSHRHSRSNEKSCLGDFIVTAAKSSKKKSKKNVSENEDKVELDLSNSEMFPEIGARKSSSLRGEKKRIKPTNIDKSQKSLSLNSFNSECFQQPLPLGLEENSAFKHQKFQPKETTNSFEAERNILKQERHKLMEKFNILNTSTPQKSSAVPQIKITHKDSVEIAQNYVQADVTKILLKDKIDLLINIYDNLLKNNLILSVVTEIYFLISIVISKQLEDDYINAENNLNDNNIDYLLKSIHNSSYFAVKSLWNLKMTLEVILEKSSLKTLGENKKVRTFYPDLAKFLLNCYCVRCETAVGPAPARGAAVVCYNMETDSADNFPTTQAFHNFKKQRDMFYEIVRWYQESQSAGASKSTLRARIKALTSQACAPANHAHLASLLTAHMLAECLPGNSQESKLSKLQRRLTCPTARDSHRLPHFTSNEMFYKEFIQQAENESFRAHLRDALSAEIVSLDATQFAVEDRGNSNIDISREYLQLAKKLGLLAKFLGYLTSLPYSPIPVEAVSKNNHVILNKEQNYTMPKEKVLENSLALRSYSQPTIDIKSLLQNAIDNSRLSITVPWIVTYLSMLDYVTLHTPYYQHILRILLELYHTRLKEGDMKRNTIVYLKSILGWFFDLPHYSEMDVVENVMGIESVDKCNLVDESIFELCPCLRDVNTLLSTCRLSLEQKEMGSFRHITPVSINVDPQARIKNKEKELQARLEEELIKSQPSSTRRVLEMVVERVCAAAVRELSARELPAARRRARACLAGLGPGRDQTTLQAATHIYNVELSQLRVRALESARAPLAARIRAALTGLLPTTPSQLHSVAFRAAKKRISNWINDHWNTTAVLCKDIESELKTIQSLSEMRAGPARTPTHHVSSFHNDESPATVLIHLKEHICLLLEGSPAGDVCARLASCACACACAGHNAYCRAPTQRALLQLTVDLCLVIVAKTPKDVTESLLLKFHAIWNTCCPDRKHYTPDNVSIMERREDLSPELRNVTDDRLPTPVSDDEVNGEVEIEEKLDKNDQINEKVDQKVTKIQFAPNSPIEKSSIVFDQALSTKLSKTSTPLKRITPISKPLSPNTKMHPTFINTQCDPNKIDQNLKSPDQNLKSPDQNLKSPDQNLKSPDQNLKSPDQNLKSPDQKFKTLDQNLKSPDIKADVIEESNEHLLEYFDRILCPRNILMLSTSNCEQSEVWEALAFVIVFLLKNDYLCEDSLTEQCLAVYRQDWPQNILESLSTCMKAVSASWSSSSSGKFTLFLDFLAEYCGDMDYDITE